MSVAATASPHRGEQVHPLPTGREEAWRYSPVPAIIERFAVADDAPAAPIPLADIDALAGRHAPTRIVMVNGLLDERLSDLGALPPGVRLASRRTDATLTRRALPAWDPPDGFVAHNRLAARDVVHLRIRPGVDLRDALHVVHVTAPAGDQVLASPRLVVEVGAGSRARLVETYVGRPGGGFTNASTILGVDDDAELALDRVQHEPPDAVHLGHLQVTQHGRSTFRANALSLGGAISRLGAHVCLGGADGTVELQGLSAPFPGTRHDSVLTVDHAASGCTSTQRFRSVVAARARSSFSGHVVVGPDTAGTDARQRSDALLLSPDAQADSRPWLEIRADDVRCTHGSTTGRLDEEALFYLRSRGIPRDLARQVLVGAFTRAVTDALEPPSLRDQVTAWLAAGR